MSPSADIGEAVIKIIGDSSAFDRTISNLGRSSSRAIEQGTRGLSARATEIGTRFGDRLGGAVANTARRGLLAAGAGIAALVGATLFKGFQRFADIEDATASLTLQLGNAAEAAGLVEKVLKVVEGTPFSLDQFLTAGRNLLVLGVGLDKIPRVLEAIGESAAASGKGAEGADQVADAFGRIATSATLSLQPIRDLEQLGVPALKILANRAGKSADQMAKDITAGSVDSQAAIDDLVEGILNGTEGIAGSTAALSGQMDLLGSTSRGALQNLGIAVSRAGAKVIKAFSEGGEGGNALVRIINSLRDTVDVLGDGMARVATRITGSKGFGKVLSFFEKLPKKVERALAANTFGDALQAFFGEGSFSLEGFLDRIIAGIKKLPTEKISAALTFIFIRAVGALPAALPEIIAAVIQIAPAIIAGIIEGLLKAAVENPLDTLLFIGALGIPGVGAGMAAFFRRLPFGFIVAPLIRGLTRAIQFGFAQIPIGQAIMGLSMRLAPAFAAVFSGPGLLVALSAAFSVLGAFLVSRIGGTLETVLKTLLTINPVTRLFGVLAIAFDEGFSNLGGIFARFFTETIPAIFERAVAFFAAIPGRVFGVLSSLPGLVLGLATSAATGFLNGIQAGFNAAVSFVASIPGRVVSAIGNLGGLLFAAGKDLLDGLLAGIKRGANAVFDFVGGIAGTIVGLKGPPAKDAVLLIPAGRMIMQGLERGLRDQMPNLVKTLGDVSGLFPASLGSSIAAGGVKGSDGAAAGGPTIINNWTLNEVGDSRTTVQRILNRQAVG